VNYGVEGNYNRIRRHVAEAVDKAYDAILIGDPGDEAVTNLLEVVIELKEIKILAMEAVHEAEFEGLVNENTQLITENSDLRSDLITLETELGKLELKLATVDDKGDLPEWVEGGYFDDIDDITDTTMVVSESDTSPRMSMLPYSNEWPGWLQFKKGERVYDQVSLLEGEIVDWELDTDRYTALYSMETEHDYIVKGVATDFRRLPEEPVPDRSAPMVYPDYDDDDDDIGHWFD